MVDLNNFTIIVEDNNAKRIVHAFNAYGIKNSFIGGATDGAYYYVLNGVPDCKRILPEFKRLSIYTLSQFIDLMEIKTYELW